MPGDRWARPDDPDEGSAMPEPATDPTPETAEHRRTRNELEQLLALAHRRLDAAGVPRTRHQREPDA
jgi:hypothetical protein